MINDEEGRVHVMEIHPPPPLLPKYVDLFQTIAAAGIGYHGPWVLAADVYQRLFKVLEAIDVLEDCDDYRQMMACIKDLRSAFRERPELHRALMELKFHVNP